MNIRFSAFFARLPRAYVALCAGIVTAILALVVANELALRWLRSNPHLMMTAADRINDRTRQLREQMIAGQRAVEYYDLANASETAEMWREFYDEARPTFESYTHFRVSAYVGRYFGVTEAGYRMSRDPGPWPIDKSNYNVFFFGGSTSFGVGPYWATIASYLQEAMNSRGTFPRKVKVYNFGRSGYFSTQEVILYQSLLREGHVPNMVVFFDGLNDFCWVDGQPSSWQLLARAFNGENERYRRLIAGYGVATPWDKLKEFAAGLPLLRAAAVLTRPADDEILPRYEQTAPAVEETPEPPEVLESIIDRYFANQRMVRAIAREYDIRPVFVWQPIPTYKYDLQHHIFRPDRLYCHVNSKYGYPRMAARVAAQPPEPDFIWAADIQEPLKEPLYVDGFHYTAPMSRRLAEYIADALVAASQGGPVTQAAPK